MDQDAFVVLLGQSVSRIWCVNRVWSAAHKGQVTGDFSGISVKNVAQNTFISGACIDTCLQVRTSLNDLASFVCIPIDVLDVCDHG